MEAAGEAEPASLGKKSRGVVLQSESFAFSCFNLFAPLEDQN